MPSYRDQIKHDERGRPYVLNERGQRVYIAQANDPAAKNTFWSKATWNPQTGNYDRSANKTSLTSLGVLAAIGGPAAYAGLGGGSAATGTGAAGGILPSSQLPMSPLYTGPVVGGSQGVSAGLGAALPWAAGGAGGDWMDPTRPPSGGNIRYIAQNVTSKGLNWWQQAALAGLSGVPSLIAASRNKPSAEEEATQEQIRQMLASQQQRFDYQNPLFQAVSQLAMSRLPTSSQRPLAETM